MIASPRSPGKRLSGDRIEAHVKIEDSGINTVDSLHDETGVAKQRIKHAMSCGAVWLTRGGTTKRLRRAKRKLQAGDELHLYYDAAILSEIPPEPALVADLGGYSVWNKPYGLRSQGSKWGDHCTVIRWAERHLQPERSAFTVHRLDRAATGLILVAHGRQVAAQLSGLFQQRQIEKYYAVTVVGDFSTRANPLRVEAAIDGKPALSVFSFQRYCAAKGHSSLQVQIDTGRKHQIRRHLAELGHPVVGDRLYGRGVDDGVNLQLEARRLAFHCPVKDQPVEYCL